MLIIESQIVLDDVIALEEQAKIRFEMMSKAFSKTEIETVLESLATSEPEMAIAIGSLNENIALNEFMVKHVSSKGEVTKTKDLKTRKRQAFQTTGLSQAKRRQIARKMVKTKKANPSTQKRATKKFKKALKLRKSQGLD